MKAALLTLFLSVSALAQEPATPPIPPAATPPAQGSVEGEQPAVAPAPTKSAPAGTPAPAGTSAPAAATDPSAATAATATDTAKPTSGLGTGYQRYDHRGALGLLLATTVERKDAGGSGSISDAGWRVGAEVGGTYPVSYSGNEFKLSLRGLFGGPVVDTSLYLGFRGYFDLSFWRAGLDQWKTFFDLDLCGHLTPSYSVDVPDGLAGTLSSRRINAPVTVTGGPRVAVGLHYDFLPVAGAYLALAGQLGFGTGVRFGAELLLGLQLRSYLLE